MAELEDWEILAPGYREFACGGAINVHSLSGIGDEATVYYAKRFPGSDEWTCFQTKVGWFLRAVRKELDKEHSSAGGAA